MVWKHYVDEANAPEVEAVNVGFDHDLNDEPEPPPQRMDFQTWCDWYSRDLMNMWFSLVDYRDMASISTYVMSDARFHDFCVFAYNMSHGYANSLPS